MKDILNLKGLRVLRVHQTDTQYLIEAEPTETKVKQCCLLQPAGLVRNGTKEQRFRDLPTHGKFVEISIKRQRFKCKSCGQVVYNDVPNLNSHHRMTERLVMVIRERGARQTFTSIADDVGLTEGTIRRVFRESLDETLHERDLETPRVLGIDEKMLMGTYRCIVGNVERRTMLDMLPNRQRGTIETWIKALPRRETIEVVCHDMWDNYRLIASKLLPDATIVVDKFHVTKLATDAMEKARRELNKDLDTATRRRLKQQRTLMFMRYASAPDSAKERMEEWFERLPTLKAAYWAKERFCNLYECADAETAAEVYEAWKASLNPELAQVYAPIPVAMKRWRPYIFNYFRYPFTNAYIESLNRLIGDFERAGRGYSFEILRAKALLAYGIEKKVPSRFVKWTGPTDLYYARPGVEIADTGPLLTQLEMNVGADMQALLDHFESLKGWGLSTLTHRRWWEEPSP